MVRKIIQIGDPILDKRSTEIKDTNTPEIQGLVKDLIDTCLSKEDITGGLSAPQIGVNLAVIVCRRVDLEDATDKIIPQNELWEVMINPRIIKTNKRESIYWEGCLSVGEGPEGLYGPVSRPDNVEISYQDLKGEVKKLTCKGFFAHIVQHEIDHLAGVLFLKYVDDPKLIWKSKDLDKYYNQYGEYPSI